jgi:hypothetical protein
VTDIIADSAGIHVNFGSWPEPEQERGSVLLTIGGSVAGALIGGEVGGGIGAGIGALTGGIIGEVAR